MTRRILIGLAVLLTLAVPAAAALAGRSMESAADIDLNTGYSFSLAEASDKQYYRFILEDPGAVSISFSHTYVDRSETLWAARLLDEEENEILHTGYQGRTEGETTSCDIGLSAGIYYLRIEEGGMYCSLEPFSFRVNYTRSDSWEAELNERRRTATPMRLNTEFSGTIRTSDDQDYYSFTLPAAGYVSLDFSHDFTDDRGQVWMTRMEDEEERCLFSGSYKGEDVSVATSIRIGLPAGTYYILVRPNAMQNLHAVGYRIRVSFTETELWEKEFNDNMVSVNPVGLNTDYSGSMISNDDRDYYCFSLPAPGFVSIRFSHDYADTSDVLWYLRLTNEDGKEYCTETYRGDALKPAESGCIGLPEGTYYLRIDSGMYYSSADFIFSIRYTESDAWEREFNDNAHDANPAEPGADISGAVAFRSDEDFYRIETPADGYLSIEFRHPWIDDSGDLWTLQILTDDKELLESCRFAGNADEPQTVITPEIPAGTWYIRISGTGDYSAADYTFRAEFHEGAVPEPAAEADNGPENEEWICPECGHVNTMQYCQYCGAKKPEALVCPVCGTVYDPDSDIVFCGNCGTKLR